MPMAWQVRRADFGIDASGRDTLLARQFGCKHRNRRRSSVARLGRLRCATRLPGRMEGNISIFWFAQG